MKKIILTIHVISLVVISLVLPVRAEMSTMGEAMTVANNWITVILQKKGMWGDANTAHVEDIQELQRDGRVLGYFCRVWPKGFIVISLMKELAPVKAYSETSTMLPECDVGLADLIKGRMEDIFKKIEKELGPINTARTEDVSGLLDINYRNTWAELERDEYAFENELASGVISMNYEEGGILLTTNWRQGDPYNSYCPAVPPGHDCNELRCSVGCTATAAAQIMRYWCWPPYGVGEGYNDPYDWPNMPDNLTAGSPVAQIFAVAELCSEIGLAIHMEYCKEGCASSAPMSGTEGMEGAYSSRFLYSTSCVTQYRTTFSTPEAWFNRLRYDLDQNRPIQYHVPKHSIVADGWQIIEGVKQYHMNYGWAGGNSGESCWEGIPNTNTWYTLDALPCSSLDEERILESIYPNVALGSVISGVYGRYSLFPYRYFDKDAYGDNATFEVGQYLQFLNNTKVSSSIGTVQFNGSGTGETRLYSHGDPSQGARINDGSITIFMGGSLKLF